LKEALYFFRLDIFPPDSGLVDVHKIHLNSLSSFWGELHTSEVKILIFHNQ
jgi:hypothetical protein